MEITTFLQSDLFKWVIIPIGIFLCRMIDVTIGTLRIIFVSKGKKVLAPLLGFFEALIWLSAMGMVMQNLTNIFCYIAYAAGFAMGNYIGIFTEEKIALGHYVVRIFAVKESDKLKILLKEAGFGFTQIDAHGSNTEVKILFCVIKRKTLSKLICIINSIEPKTFYSIEEARATSSGIFPQNECNINSSSIKTPSFIRFDRMLRKRK